MLAILAVESLHGTSQVRLDAAHAFDTDHRICVINASSEVGRDLNRLFIGFVAREYGESAFEVCRVEQEPQEPQPDHPQGTENRARPTVGPSGCCHCRRKL